LFYVLGFIFPLKTNCHRGEGITADLDRVSPIVTDLGNNLIFRGVITYKSEEYSFSSRI